MSSIYLNNKRSRVKIKKKKRILDEETTKRLEEEIYKKFENPLIIMRKKWKCNIELNKDIRI
jgi:hypothetical protein